jgi:predicted transposase YbfD/YdcC
VSVSSSISPAVGHLSDLTLWEAELAADPEQVIVTLADRLARVPDPRAVRGLRHRLVVILVLAACASLVVGNDSVAAIRQWAAGTSQHILARIGARYDGWTGRYVVPSERTFRRVLAAIDGDILDGQVGGYVIDVLRGNAPTPALPAVAGPVEREQRRAASRPSPTGPLPAVAIDGKVLRGSASGGTRMFLVAGIDHHSGAVLGQRRVADKRGENSTIEPLLLGMDLAGWDLTGLVLTLDALHTSRKTARLITDTMHAHYVLILKGNQPTAYRTARHLLSNLDITHAEHTHTHTHRGHGRHEQRTIHTTTVENTLFPGARQAFRVHRHTTGPTGTHQATVHGITSLPHTSTTPADLNHYVRGHWTVENRLHWTRDVTFGEDAHQLRTATAPRSLASFRNLTISTYRLARRANIAHARRELHNHADAFAVYGI